MSFIRMFENPNVTPEQYDAVTQRLGVKLRACPTAGSCTLPGRDLVGGA
jgi:hypothetical protein